MTRDLNMTKTLTSRSRNRRMWISLIAFAATCFFLFPPRIQASDQRRVEVEIENFQFVSGEMDLHAIVATDVLEHELRAGRDPVEGLVVLDPRREVVGELQLDQRRVVDPVG